MRKQRRSQGKRRSVRMLTDERRQVLAHHGRPTVSAEISCDILYPVIDHKFLLKNILPDVFLIGDLCMNRTSNRIIQPAMPDKPIFVPYIAGHDLVRRGTRRLAVVVFG